MFYWVFDLWTMSPHERLRLAGDAYDIAQIIARTLAPRHSTVRLTRFLRTERQQW
jgi:hypothetical protein